jgi:hypothetical protein
VAISLRNLGLIARSQGDYARAEISADQHWRMNGAHRYAPDEPAYERDLARVRAGVDEQAFETAWREGAAMPSEEAIAYALGELRAPENLPEVETSR